MEAAMSRYYQQILDYVTQQIEQDTWPLGYKLPREIDLCKQFDVSRSTVRRALSELVQSGRLKRIKGTGTFVTQPQIIDKTTLFLQSFSDELRARGETPVTELLECRFLPAEEEEIIRMLGIERGETVLKTRRLRYSKEHQEKGVMVLSTDYFPKDVGEIVQRYDLEKISLTQILRENSLPRRRIEKRFSAQEIGLKDGRLLSAQPHDLALLVCSQAQDEKGRPIEYSKTVYPLDRYEFKIWIETA